MKASKLLRIGDKIRLLRENKKWTQKQLAEMSQINEVQIRRYENNQSLPRDAQLIKIANALDVDKEDFFKETGHQILIDINTDDIRNKVDIPTSFTDINKSMKSMRQELDNVTQLFDKTKQTQLEFIQTFIKNKKNSNIEIDRIADLLYYYDCLLDNEKTAFIYLLQKFTLMNIEGKNKILEFSDIIFGNLDYRNKE